MTYADLIARLEAVTEGNQLLDVEIARALGWKCWAEEADIGSSAWLAADSASRMGDWHGLNWGDAAGTARGDCHNWPFTTSNDAALTLLPEWASFELTRSAAGEPTFTRCRLWDWRRCATGVDPGNEWKSEGNRPLPINICIAALKTRREP